MLTVAHQRAGTADLELDLRQEDTHALVLLAQRLRGPPPGRDRTEETPACLAATSRARRRANRLWAFWQRSPQRLLPCVRASGRQDRCLDGVLGSNPGP